MTKFNIGDLVVLKSGSMRMVVESCDDETAATVWCNEGVIGRDRFPVTLLNKWEFREENTDRRGGGRPSNDREGGGKGFRGDREGGGKPYRGADRGDDRPPRKTGWDGKPRDKKFFRKDS